MEINYNLVYTSVFVLKTPLILHNVCLTGSVPFCRQMANCSGVSFAFHSVSGIFCMETEQWNKNVIITDILNETQERGCKYHIW